MKMSNLCFRLRSYNHIAFNKFNIKAVNFKLVLTIYVMFCFLNAGLVAQTCDAAADFMITGGGCAAMNFTANTQTGIHNWEFGDGSTSTSVNPTYTYPLAAPGEFVVIHTVELNGSYFSCSKVVQSECEEFTCQTGIDIKATAKGCTFTFSIAGNNGTAFWNYGD